MLLNPACILLSDIVFLTPKFHYEKVIWIDYLFSIPVFLHQQPEDGRGGGKGAGYSHG
jgi:hypothetical protein